GVQRLDEGERVDPRAERGLDGRPQVEDRGEAPDARRRGRLDAHAEGREARGEVLDDARVLLPILLALGEPRLAVLVFGADGAGEGLRLERAPPLHEEALGRAADEGGPAPSNEVARGARGGLTHLLEDRHGIDRALGPDQGAARGDDLRGVSSTELDLDPLDERGPVLD